MPHSSNMEKTEETFFFQREIQCLQVVACGLGFQPEKEQILSLTVEQAQKGKFYPKTFLTYEVLQHNVRFLSSEYTYTYMLLLVAKSFQLCPRLCATP